MSGKGRVERSTVDGASRQALRQLVDPQPERHDLVIGFVGAIGTAWDPVLRAFENSLRRFDYVTRTVHVAGLLDGLEYKPWDPLPGRDSRDYYERRMNAGDTFRADYGNRSFHGGAGRSGGRETPFSASQGRQADRVSAAELQASRRSEASPTVYGEAFSLVGVASTAEERRKTLSESYSPLEDALSLEAERLVARDESDSGNRQFGQNVRDTYSWRTCSSQAV